MTDVMLCMRLDERVVPQTCMMWLTYLGIDGYCNSSTSYYSEIFYCYYSVEAYEQVLLSKFSRESDRAAARVDFR
jgi:hypothetical protein